MTTNLRIKNEKHMNLTTITTSNEDDNNLIAPRKGSDEKTHKRLQNDPKQRSPKLGIKGETEVQQHQNKGYNPLSKTKNKIRKTSKWTSFNESKGNTNLDRTKPDPMNSSKGSNPNPPNHPKPTADKSRTKTIDQTVNRNQEKQRLIMSELMDGLAEQTALSWRKVAEDDETKSLTHHTRESNIPPTAQNHTVTKLKLSESVENNNYNKSGIKSKENRMKYKLKKRNTELSGNTKAKPSKSAPNGVQQYRAKGNNRLIETQNQQFDGNRRNMKLTRKTERQQMNYDSKKSNASLPKRTKPTSNTKTTKMIKKKEKRHQATKKSFTCESMDNALGPSHCLWRSKLANHKETKLPTHRTKENHVLPTTQKQKSAKMKSPKSKDNNKNNESDKNSSKNCLEFNSKETIMEFQRNMAPKTSKSGKVGDEPKGQNARSTKASVGSKCSHNQESVQKQLQGNHRKPTQTWRKARNKFDRWMTTTGARQSMIGSDIVRHLLTWRYDDEPTDLAQDSGEVNCDYSKFDFVPKRWALEQKCAHKRYPPKQLGRRWTDTLLQKLWDMAWDQWRYRNADGHQGDEVRRYQDPELLVKSKDCFLGPHTPSITVTGEKCPTALWLQGRKNLTDG